MKASTRQRLMENSLGLSNPSLESFDEKLAKQEPEVQSTLALPLSFGASAFAFRNRNVAEMFQRQRP